VRQRGGRLLLSGVGVALLGMAAACRPPGVGETDFGADHPNIQVKVGERFALVVPDDSAAGDHWTVKQSPDPRVVGAHGRRFTPVGAGGQLYFSFTGRSVGATTITLFDCWKCAGDTPSTALSKQRSKQVVFRVTVG
jgi:inhibitor of cysteine peptidase